MDLDDFRNDVKGGGANFSDWRSRGKLIAFIHPASKIGKRVRVRFRKVVTNEETKEKEIWTIPRFFHGDEDITARFLKWLEENDDIDADDVVLRVKLGKKKEEYLKGDLLGMEDYDWKKRLFRPRTEYLFSMIDVDKADGTEIVTLPWGAGKKLMKKIDSQIEEYGEEEGNPFETPYAFKLTFDEDERGTDMYDVERHQAKVSKKIQKIFDEVEPDDTMYFSDPAEENLEFGTSRELLREMCVVDCPLLEKDTEEQEPPKKKKKKGKKAKPKKEKKAGKKLKKKKSKPKSNLIPVEECEEGATYEYDGDELKFKRYLPKSKRYLFVDDDGEKIRLPEDAEVKPVKVEAEPEPEEEEEPESAEPEKVKVEDCEEGETYYDTDGDKLTFVRYKHNKEKGLFKDEDGDSILLPGDDVVFTEPPGESDELDPIPASKKASKQRKPKGKKKKVEDEPEEEEEDEEGDDDGEGDVMECPYCDKDVKANAKECPHCGGEFDDEAPFDD